ncbi:hypothetical protein CRE_02479 [Caenorhabditis remanei]|uniref:Uncharacterized protein n=1 Tax=Caenorhabditis remanei TaxID=31234 RepID=E3MWR4_CAERE|nr:hypothetical protein CRE_02479 [Caenorhabditis remanei]
MIIQNILVIISFMTNSLLTFLISTKSPKTMGSYKYLMAFMTGFELVYALIDLLIQPIRFNKQAKITNGVGVRNGRTSNKKLMMRTLYLINPTTIPPKR